MKFATKLGLTIAAVTLAFAGTASVVLYFTSRSILLSDVEQVLESGSRQAAGTLDSLLFERIGDVTIMSSDLALSRDLLDVQEASRRLQDFRNTYKTFLSISLFEDGIRVADASSLELGAGALPDAFWDRLVSSSTPIVATNSAMVFGKQVVRVGGPVVGHPGRFVVAYTGVDLLGQILVRSVSDFHGDADFFLSDSGGNLLFATQNQGSRWPAIRAAIGGHAMTANGSGTGATRLDVPYLYGFARSSGYLTFPGNNWLIAGLVPRSIAYAPLRRLQLVLIILWGGGIIVVASGVVLVTRRIVRPVLRITEAARNVAEGDLRTPLEVPRAQDEIGLLALAFRDMHEALQHVTSMAEAVAMGDLRDRATPRSERDQLGLALSSMQDNLRIQISGISAATRVIAESGQQMSELSSQLTLSATESAATVNETSATVAEVTQSAIASSERAREVSRAAAHTIEVSRRGEQSVAASADAMQRIKVQMTDIGSSIARLSDRSEAIGEIIMSVGELSDQSSVLAVNAAIEAARAGEHGRGFAVVASEIRALAGRSKVATEQVRRLLGDIESATTTAVHSMQEGARAMEEGIQQSAESGDAIRHLSEQIKQAAEAAMQIAAASRQQLAGMDRVATAVEAIRDASELNASSSRRLEGELRNLTNVGERLRQSVLFYRVGVGGEPAAAEPID